MIKQTYTIHVPATQVWAALTDPKIIKQWSSTSVVMDDNEGTEFKLWDGDIWGTNTKVTQNKLLEQNWYGGKWPKPSKVVIRLKSDGDKTTVHLAHSDVPEDEEKDFADGWKDYYFGPITELLESGG